LKSENRDSYNERNFENLVNYYGKELKRILQGVSARAICVDPTHYSSFLTMEAVPLEPKAFMKTKASP